MPSPSTVLQSRFLLIPAHYMTPIASGCATASAEVDVIGTNILADLTDTSIGIILPVVMVAFWTCEKVYCRFPDTVSAGTKIKRPDIIVCPRSINDVLSPGQETFFMPSRTVALPPFCSTNVAKFGVATASE